MWIILGLVVFWILFRQASDFVVGGASIMDADEFSKFPTDMKISLKKGLAKITDALGAKVSSEWNSLTDSDKKKWQSQIDSASSKIVSNIAKSPNVKTAINPATHNDVKRPATSASEIKTSNFAPF